MIVIVQSLFILETIKAKACKIAENINTTHTHARTVQLEEAYIRIRAKLSLDSMKKC